MLRLMILWILHTDLIYCRENLTAVVKYSVLENHHICLRCSGSSGSDVVWTHNDRKVPVTRRGSYETNEDPDRYLLLSDGSLLLLTLDESDGGEYRCNERLEAELQVLKGHDLLVPAGWTLLLPCRGSSRLKQRWFYRRRGGRRRELIFTWFGNGTVKSEREGGRLSYGNDGLLIHDLQPEDAGEYLCNGHLQARLTVLTVHPEPTSILRTSRPATAEPKTAESKRRDKSRAEGGLLVVSVVCLALMILFLVAVCVLLSSVRCRREKRFTGSAAFQSSEETELQPWRMSITHFECEAPDGSPGSEEMIHYASLGRQNWRERPCRTSPDQNHHKVIYSSVITKPAAAR